LLTDLQPVGHAKAAQASRFCQLRTVLHIKYFCSVYCGAALFSKWRARVFSVQQEKKVQSHIGVKLVSEFAEPVRIRIMNATSFQSMMSFKNAWTEAENELSEMCKPKLAHGGGWNPYSFEGGCVVFFLQACVHGFRARLCSSCAAIAGSTFAILAGDTRMSQFEVSPLSRDTDKVHVL
jgi:hypothetical protein